MEGSNPLLPKPTSRNSKDLAPKETEDDETTGPTPVARKQREWSPSKPKSRSGSHTEFRSSNQPRSKVAPQPVGKPVDVIYRGPYHTRGQPITNKDGVQPSPSNKNQAEEKIATKEMTSKEHPAKSSDLRRSDAKTPPYNKESDAKTQNSSSTGASPNQGSSKTDPERQDSEKNKKKGKDSKKKEKEASSKPEVTSIPQTNFALGLLVTCCFNCPFGVLAMYCSLRAAAAYRDGDKRKGLSRARASILLSLFGIMLTMVVVSSVVVWISVNKHSKKSYSLPNSSALGF